LFHGFGQDHSAFDSWLKTFANEFTFYSFDLFFHGKSEWRTSGMLEKEDWQKILTLFFEKENLSNVIVAGFSLGAKFALATIELFPAQVKKVIFIAPDGIKLNFWYKVATSFSLARLVFKKFVTFPQPFFWLLKILDFFRLTNKFLLRFAHSQMNTIEKRKKVYNSWVYFRRLKFDIESLAVIINKNRIEITIIMGRYDKVIPLRRVELFVKKISLMKFHILETGHNDLIERSKTLIK
ncbi:MAG TPA: alpha/beta hydrolase, partial [Cytophagales bacterium]|nr:alpha/beta hydrolase [Cytophagales bacterium]